MISFLLALSPFTEGKSKKASGEEPSETTDSTQDSTDKEADKEEDTGFDVPEELEDSTDDESEKDPKIDETEMSDVLAEDLKTMKVSSPPKQYSMGFQNPYIMYQYVEDGNQLVSIDVLVPNVHRKYIRPSIHSSGMYFDLGIAVPEFFWQANRLIAANKGEEGFNKNTHKATAFQQAAKKIEEDFNTFETEEVLSGAPQRFKLPFKVEHDYYTGDGGKGWEVQIFDNEDEDLHDELEGEVMSFFVLSVNLVSVEKPRKQKRKGTMRRIGSPLSAAPKPDEAAVDMADL
jgi:hypothetical protein